MNEQRVKLGEKIEKSITLTKDEIIEGATFCGDLNPLHVDEAYAAQARFGGLIASGSHTTALFSAYISTYLAQSGPIIGLEMNYRFHKPIFPDEAISLVWEVVELVENEKSQSTLINVEGAIRDAHQIALVTGDARILLPHNK